MLKIGMEIMIELHNQGKEEMYKSKIVDVRDDQIYIYYPINTETNRTSYLQANTTMYVNFVSENLTAYTFQTYVNGRIRHPVPMLILHYPGKKSLLKIQRRQYVRIAVSIDVAFEFFESGSKFATVTEDFSAGAA
ncbi:flagellar brake protein [Bacillus sp. N9]